MGVERNSYVRCRPCQKSSDLSGIELCPPCMTNKAEIERLVREIRDANNTIYRLEQHRDTLLDLVGGN